MFFWSPLKYEIEEFKKNLINRRNEFAKMVTQRQISSADVDKERKTLRDWEETQENPLKKLEFLNTILNNFKQKVKTDIDSVEEIEFIKLETLNGITLKGDILSTGTQQILLTALPLYSLKPENSIILFDEPESSLYPDIQTQIIEFYTNLAKESQFFFATHSPLIASSFEPWEIVELKFNEEGNVYREKYFEGENHVDNYKFYPEYLRYDTILSKVFDLPNEANPKRRKILDEIAILEKQLKNGASQEEKIVLWEKYQVLQKKVNWEEDDEKY
jgi:predicted ATP-dependent endonuclease of OLD family